jgi:hypothetical protein
MRQIFTEIPFSILQNKADFFCIIYRNNGLQLELSPKRKEKANRQNHFSRNRCGIGKVFWVKKQIKSEIGFSIL